MDRRWAILATFIFGLLAAPFAAAADTGTVQLVGDRLRAGALRPLAAELETRLAATPADDQARLALGATQFLLTVEDLAQAMYRHGLEEPEALRGDIPFLRLPVPRNPTPEALDYDKMRAIFAAARDGFMGAEATLSGVTSAEVKLPLAIGLVRLDLDGDGTASDSEALWQVFDATLAGGGLSEEQARHFIIAFDRGDVAWLRGYCHLLSAIAEFMLAHDWRDGFEATFHAYFPRAGLPAAALNEAVPPEVAYVAPIADAVAFVHLAHWPVIDKPLMASVLHHLEQVAALSRESWRFYQAETDDEDEWIPNVRQVHGVIPGLAVSQETVDGWMAFLDEFDALLKGKLLIPHWRLAKGINLRRVFTEPRTFDPVLWAQGSAALPYAENGPQSTAESWQRIMMLLGGNFLGYAVWFN